MDSSALEALISAYTAHPDPRLLTLILDGAEDGPGASDVMKLIEGLSAGAFADATSRRAAAELAIAQGAHGLAKRLLDGSTDPKDQVVLARALHGLGDVEAARETYRQAVAGNPAIEDVDVARVLDTPTDDDRAKLANVISFAGRRAERQGGAAPEGPATEAVSILPSAAERSAPRITFADVGGLEEVKAQIRRRIITPFLKPSLFEKFKRKAGGGVLLYGPPGCGKTLIARATAGECNARFINVHIAEILDMYVGQSEKRLAAAFEEARRETPTVLFFDEIEALAARRRYGAHDASASLVSTFLSELDGFQQNNQGVLVLAATNVPWAVDAAFRRPGRFDRIAFVPPPDRQARRDILVKLLNGLPGAETLAVDRIADRTSGFSGADLKNLVETAADIAIEESLAGETPGLLSERLLDEAVRDVKPTTIEWLTTARNYAKYSNTGGQYDDVVAFIDKHGR